MTELGSRALAVVGPIAGLATFLWWVGHVFDDWKLPLHVQDTLRGGNENPIIRIGEAASDLVHFEVDGLHFPFAVAMIVLAVVAWRRLPGGLALYAAATVGIHSTVSGSMPSARATCCLNVSGAPTVTTRESVMKSASALPQ